jgi:hypothetical protein
MRRPPAPGASIRRERVGRVRLGGASARSTGYRLLGLGRGVAGRRQLAGSLGIIGRCLRGSVGTGGCTATEGFEPTESSRGTGGFASSDGFTGGAASEGCSTITGSGGGNTGSSPGGSTGASIGGLTGAPINVGVTETRNNLVTIL